MRNSLTLPIAILTGIISYFAYVNIHALDPTHHFVGTVVHCLQPMLLFAMLFVSFCKVEPKQLRPRPWMLKPLVIQLLGFLLPAAAVILFPEIPYAVVLESFMICMICPTATAASVVTSKLGGNPSVVVSYTCLINLACALVIPCIVPLLHHNTGHLGFTDSCLLILGKVFPLLVLPLMCAITVRYILPRFHRKVLQCKDLAFNLWAVALTLAIAVTVKAIVHSNESLLSLAMIALASLIACVLQFWTGHRIGIHYKQPVAATQSLGQKNTIFAIWMGYTFLSPVTALAGGFYSVWHNVINSWQLMRSKS